MARVVALLGALLLAAGCGQQPTGSATSSAAAAATSEATSAPTASGAPHVTPMADAPASDVVIHLVAEHVRWDTDTITAPAGATWTLEFENRDGQPEHHNFTIVNGPAVTDRIFMTPNLQGPATERYVIPGLPSGTYEFVCTVHPDGMRGTLVVE